MCNFPPNKYIMLCEFACLHFCCFIQIDCQGVMQGGVAVALIDSTDNVVDLVEKSSNEGVETFADNILKYVHIYHIQYK